MNKVLIVGSGFSGITIARCLAEKDYDITLIDKRDHIGGNCYDYINEVNIKVHKYGPHLFHTNNNNVFNFLSRFTEWTEYKHKVKALLENGVYVTLPVNKETKKIVGEENVVDTFIRPYSEKMWGMKLEEIDPQIINRVPIRDDMNDLYFPNDIYQFLPKEGYTELFKKMVDHKNIKLKLETKFHKEMEKNFDHVFNSMPIDEYYDFCFGNLSYRSLKFNSVNIPAPFLLPASQVNFTHKGKYTRMIEWKRIPNHGVNDEMTTISYEEPCDYTENNFERYYPVKDIDGKNRELYLKYKSIENQKVTFIGRLGLYVYMNMDQAINSSLEIVKHFLNTKK